MPAKLLFDSLYQFSCSVVSDSLQTIDCSTPGLPVHYQFPVHQVSYAIQPSHPVSSPSPPAFNLSQHEDLSQCVSSSYQFSSVQSLSPVWLFATPWTVACQASLSFTISWSLLRFMSIELVMPPNHLTLWRPFFLLLSIFPRIRVFSNESVLYIR